MKNEEHSKNRVPYLAIDVPRAGSRLFEMERTIPQVASVSGHRSWQSLKRYTHLRQTGDKYEGWKWNPTTSKT